MADLSAYARDSAAFIDRFITKNERGEPFRLAPHQREVLGVMFAFDADGRLSWDTGIWSAVKKDGKTTINAAVVTWWAFTQEAPNELKLAANDLEQSVSRTFTTIKGLLKHNPELGASAEVTATRIVLSNGTVIQALANDYAGEAGANQGLSSWTELWASTSEAARRMWEELTPVPTRRNSIRFVDTYAGFEGEGDLLFGLYKAVVDQDEHPDGEGVRIHPTLPVFANRAARVCAYWDHEPRMPWQTRAYRDAQRRTLRPNTYLRLHENRWTTAESTLITPELWDPCVDAARRPLLASEDLVLYAGLDGSVSGDNAAAEYVAWQGARLLHVRGAIWRPSKAHPLDIEQTIEADVLHTHQRFRLRRVLADPYQLHRSITTLKAKGVKVEGFAQTQANTSRMGGALWELLKTGGLRLYPDAELRQQALNTVAHETPFGFRITKQTGSRKIDGVAALALACVAALEDGPREYVPLELLEFGGGGGPLENAEAEALIQQMVGEVED